MKKVEEYYPPEIIELARENAVDMIRKGESLRRIKFGHESGFFYLSDDPGKLISVKTVEVEGKTFHIGLFNE